MTNMPFLTMTEAYHSFYCDVAQLTSEIIDGLVFNDIEREILKKRLIERDESDYQETQDYMLPDNFWNE